MILIVEDQHDTRVVLARLVQRAGYEAVGVADGPAALLFLRTTLPALIILDHRMPGMDGLDVLRRVRADRRTGGVPVVFFSADEPGLVRRAAMDAGAQDYFQKGVADWARLVGCIEGYMTRWDRGVAGVKDG